jgi:hypothetical protein
MLINVYKVLNFLNEQERLNIIKNLQINSIRININDFTNYYWNDVIYKYQEHLTYLLLLEYNKQYNYIRYIIIYLIEKSLPEISILIDIENRFKNLINSYKEYSFAKRRKYLNYDYEV